MNAAPSPPRIAVLMTCHNRRELTLRCLQSLADQPLFDMHRLYLVDDGCVDGTSDMARQLMPQARIISGDGSLYWNGGMRRAWEEAKSAHADHDFYLWLNDDVELQPGTIEALVKDADRIAKRGAAIIVAAATANPDDPTQITYGGHRRANPRRPFRLGLVMPTGTPEPVDTISGNIVLVSSAAERVLGNLDASLTHIFGDLDYAMRARAAGVPVVLASAVGGTCAGNPGSGTSADPALSKVARLRLRWREERGVHVRDWRRLVAMHSRNPVERIRHRIGPYLKILLDSRHEEG